jgi:glutamate transport system substrate-binding protein
MVRFGRRTEADSAAATQAPAVQAPAGTTAEPSSPSPASPPSPDPAARAKRRWAPRGQIVRLGVLVVVLVLSVVVAVQVLDRTGKPTINDLLRQAGWADKTSLNVGVFGDTPDLSLCVQGTNDCRGFDAQIAVNVAEWLGLKATDINWARVQPSDRERMLGTSVVTGNLVHLDIVVAAFSITDERKNTDHMLFAGPYLNTQTTVLTRKGPQVKTLSALAVPVQVKGGKTRLQKVCTPGTSTSDKYLQDVLDPRAIVESQLNSECVQELHDGKVDAVVTDAAILAGFAQADPQLQLNHITSTQDEHWGIGIGQDSSGQDRTLEARQQLVLNALNDQSDKWIQAFELLPPTIIQDPKTGIAPQEVASDLQPALEGLKPVRRWPWDHSGRGPGR